MPYPKNRNTHRPPHIYFSNQIYFITGRTLNKIPFFKALDNKKIFIKVLNNCLARFSINLYAWALLDNHYHLLVKSSDILTDVTPKSNDILTDVTLKSNDSLTAVTPKRFGMTPVRALSKFINTLHSVSALKINNLDNQRGRKIWYQYWDHCIRNESDFYKHFNYIHQNPIKHGLIKNLVELEKYQFSSYKDWINKKNKTWLLDCFERYPIKDFVEKSESVGMTK